MRYLTGIAKKIISLQSTLFNRTRGNQFHSEGFDHKFYREFYRDLSGMHDPSLLAKHYAEHGRTEGRFPNEAAMRDALARLPADFNPEGYRRHNPNLGDLSDDAARIHYATIGRLEGFAYRSDQIPGFDPDHFREIHPAFASVDDATCQAAWQAEGGPNGPPGTQVEHLRRLDLPLRTYPAAFPWRFYTRLYPRTAAHRWAALAHFLREGFAEVGTQIPYGEDAPSFLIALGDHFAHRNDPAAVQAYELAVALGASPTVAHQKRLAEAYGRVGAWSAALDLYAHLFANGICEEAIMRCFVSAAAARQDWPRLFTLLPQALARTGVMGDTIAREATETYFAHRSRTARALYADHRRAEGDAVLAEAVERVEDLMTACGSSGARTAPERPMIAILADRLPDRARHRLDQRVALLGRIGFEARIFDLGTVRAFEEAVPAATAAILVRMPAWPTVVQALVCAKRAGVPTLYETDELIVDPRFAPPPLEAFAGRIGDRVHQDLEFGVALYRAAAKLCDFGLAPNRVLAAHLDGIVARGRSFIVRDAIVPEARSPGVGEQVRLFLHAPQLQDVRATEAAGAALLEAFRREPRVALTTAGFVTLDEAFAPFADRISQHGPVPDWEEALRGSDLNLVLADEGEAAACVAVTGWLAAARFGIPTLASATRAYCEDLEDGVDVRLASKEAEWRAALSALIAEPNLRQALGTAAARSAGSRYTENAAAEDCRAMIKHVGKLRQQ